MISLRVGVMTSGAISTVAVSSVSLHDAYGGFRLLHLVSIAYLGLACVLVALILTLSITAVFGSLSRRAWSLATLSVLLGRPNQNPPPEQPALENPPDPQDTK